MCTVQTMTLPLTLHRLHKHCYMAHLQQGAQPSMPQHINSTSCTGINNGQTTAQAIHQDTLAVTQATADQGCHINKTHSSKTTPLGREEP